MGYKLKNPFAYGKIVEGENFIGRGLMLEELKELAIKGEQTHIEGLPRMGKSSLLKRCFMEQNMFHWWVTKQKIVPIFLDGLSTPKELWYSLASKIGNILYDLKADSIIDVDDDIIYRCENLYTIEDSNVRHEKLISIFEKLKKSLNFKFITIVDEFDNAIGYKYSNNDFKKLKVLGSYSTIFTCSRRRAEYIEKKSSGTVDFCENKREFFVGVFTKEDVEVYWNHYRKYFNVLNDKQMIEYRNLVSKYAGRQPQLMNYLNSQVLDHNDLLSWCNGTITRKKEIELGYRIYVKNMFQKHMEKVEEQGLKDTAINLVTSPFAGISEEKKQLLLNYTFINIVPSKVKKEYFGFDVGPMADEGDNKYVCLSEFTSHLLYEEYEPTLTLSELLTKTEMELRTVVRSCIKQQWPESPFAVRYDDGTDIGYEENWVRPFLGKVHRPEVEDGLFEMKRTRFQREENSTIPKDQRNIDLVSSSTLGNLWYVFIKWQWNFFYSKIFDTKHWIKVSKYEIYQGSNKIRDEWHDKVYDPVRIIRNSDSHRNLKDHSNEYIKQVEKKCKDICEDIENWKKKQNR